jgi:hypothetical protein
MTRRIPYALPFACVLVACGARDALLVDGEESTGSTSSSGQGGASSTSSPSAGGSTSTTTSGPGGGVPFVPCEALELDGEPTFVDDANVGDARRPKWVRGGPGSSDAILVFGAWAEVHWTKVVDAWGAWPPATSTAWLDGVLGDSHAVGYAGESAFSLLYVDAGEPRFAPLVTLLGIPQTFPVAPDFPGLPARALFARPVGDQVTVGFELDPPWTWGQTESFMLEAGSLSKTSGTPSTTQRACDDVHVTGDAAASPDGWWVLARSAPSGACADDVPPAVADRIEITSFDPDGGEQFGVGVDESNDVLELELGTRLGDAKHWLAWRTAASGIRTSVVEPHAEAATAPSTAVGVERVPLSLGSGPLGDRLLLAWVEDPMGNPPDVVAAVVAEDGSVREVTVAADRSALGPVSIVADPVARGALVAWEELDSDGARRITAARLRCVTPPR